ncbi:hypothetical protein EHV15_34230 [Paenibacillus oralis]|uniref:Uncharacterized protein n=1 Tax=Paenibacillus oralis TaxID=2490856 RepID=A0A3P3T9F4_9BACL|nr:hypothetical protein [Paenibacillus oralis]RRJ54657.1 hypothetical protein EHV15_34230 [Paenibacillus oralis]
MLDQINRYSGWFTERARRSSWKRYVVFTKLTLPLDFIILVPEHSNDVSEMRLILDSHEFPEITPKLIFDQEEQVVLRTMNGELVLKLLIRIIENELAEFEETGTLSGNWRHNRVQYFSKLKPINLLVQDGEPFALSLH